MFICCPCSYNNFLSLQHFNERTTWWFLNDNISEPTVCSPRWLQSVIERPWLLLRGLEGVLLQIHTKPWADWFQILQRRTVGSHLIDFSKTICWAKFKPPGQAARKSVVKRREQLLVPGMYTNHCYVMWAHNFQNINLQHFKLKCDLVETKKDSILLCFVC